MFHASAHGPASLFTGIFGGDPAPDEFGVLKYGIGIQVRQVSFGKEFPFDPPEVQVVFNPFIGILFVEIIDSVIQSFGRSN